MEIVKLNGTTIQGGGLKYAITPQIVLGNTENGYEPGTLLDANASASFEQQAELKVSENYTVDSKKLITVRNNISLPTSNINTQAHQITATYGGNISTGGNQFIGGFSNISVNGGTIIGHRNIVTSSGTVAAKILKREFIGNVSRITIDVKETSELGKLFKENKVNILVNFIHNKDGKWSIAVIDSEYSIRNGGNITISDDGYIQLNNIYLNKIASNKDITELVLSPNNISGSHNIVNCRHVSLKGDYNLVSGYLHTVDSNWSATTGVANELTQTRQHAFGLGLKLTNTGECALGVYNKSVQNPKVNGKQDKLPKDDEKKDTTLFTIGNGTDSNNRSNALEIKYNGDMYLNDGRKVQDVLPQTPAATRPANPVLGQMFFDTVKNKPLWFGKDNKWVDANGTVVA